MKRKVNEKQLQTFAHNVTWLRKRYGISKKNMCKMLGIGTNSLNKLEKGEIPSRLTVEILFNINKKFKICSREILEEQLWNEQIFENQF